MNDKQIECYNFTKWFGGANVTAADFVANGLNHLN